MGCCQPEIHFAEMTKFARTLERELGGAILHMETYQTMLSDITKRHFNDQVAADARWNKLRDERDEARSLAAHWRDTASGPFAKAGPLPWENSELSGPTSGNNTPNSTDTAAPVSKA